MEGREAYMATLGRQKLCRQQQGHVWREGGMVLRAWGGKGIDVALILVSCLSTLRWASTYGFSTPESQPASHPGSWTTALRLTLTFCSVLLVLVVPLAAALLLGKSL